MTDCVLLFDHRFRRGPNGTVYSPANYGYGLISQRYLGVFDRLTIVGRVDESELDGEPRAVVLGSGVTIEDVGTWSGLRGLLRPAWRTARAVWRLRGEDVVVVAVLPGALGVLGGAVARLRAVPYAVELVGDIREVFTIGRAGIGPGVAAGIAGAVVRFTVRGAIGAAYVTERELQRRYPARKGAITSAYSSIQLGPESFVDFIKDEPGSESRPSGKDEPGSESRSSGKDEPGSESRSSGKDEPGSESRSSGENRPVIEEKLGAVSGRQDPEAGPNASPSSGVARSGGLVRLVGAGSLERPYKGFHLLLDALAALDAEAGPDAGLTAGPGTGMRAEAVGWRLTIVGGGKELDVLRAQARRLGLDSKVTFTGQVSGPSVVRAYFDAADLFVLSSLTEGLPRVLIEAMARGKAAVAANVGGVAELVEAEAMVPAGDRAALAVALRRAITEPDWRRKQAERNLAVSRRYALERLTAVREEFYRALAGKSASGKRRDAARAR